MKHKLTPIELGIYLFKKNSIQCCFINTELITVRNLVKVSFRREQKIALCCRELAFLNGHQYELENLSGQLDAFLWHKSTILGRTYFSRVKVVF